MALDFNVNLAPQVAMQMIDNGIVNGSLSGERIDYYEVHNTAGYLCITAVYEKFYYRAGNRLTLMYMPSAEAEGTALFSNLTGALRKLSPTLPGIFFAVTQFNLLFSKHEIQKGMVLQ